MSEKSSGGFVDGDLAKGLAPLLAGQKPNSKESTSLQEEINRGRMADDVEGMDMHLNRSPN